MVWCVCCSTDFEVPLASGVPIVFMHGVGAGVLPYVSFIQRLTCLGHPVIAIEVHNLTMRWHSHIPTIDETARIMNSILKEHGVGKVAFVGHSFGTFFISRFLQLHAEKVSYVAVQLVGTDHACKAFGDCQVVMMLSPCHHQCTLSIIGFMSAHGNVDAASGGAMYCSKVRRKLDHTVSYTMHSTPSAYSHPAAVPMQVHSLYLIDPACCCMWTGDLMGKFVYRLGKSYLSLPIKFIGSELHSCTTVSRNYFWTHCNLWSSQFPARSMVVLCGKDDLVPVNVIKHSVSYSTARHSVACYYVGMFWSSAVPCAQE